MADYALGMGSNLGDRISNLLEGVRFLMSRSMMGRFRLSAVYQTPPIEDVKGEDFYNCVLAGNFYGSAEQLMGYCREAEILMGSMVSKSNEPRTLDLDLLFFDGEVRDDPELTLPHPGIGRRRFVLRPLSEVWEEEIPGLGKTAEELLKKCRDGSRLSMVFSQPVQGCFWEVTS